MQIKDWSESLYKKEDEGCNAFIVFLVNMSDDIAVQNAGRMFGGNSFYTET